MSLYISPACCCMRCQTLPCCLEGSPLLLTFPFWGMPARRRPGRPSSPCSLDRSYLVVADRMEPVADDLEATARVTLPN